MLKSFTCIIVLGAIVAASGFAAKEDGGETRSLNMAVQDFNHKASTDSIGKTQPPLTEDEVVAAIRGWIPEHTPGVTDDVSERFQEIAETGTLPDGAELSFTTGWTGYRGFKFQVWWVDLSIKLDPEKTGVYRYTFRIRDQKISSRKMTPDELASPFTGAFGGEPAPSLRPESAATSP